MSIQNILRENNALKEKNNKLKSLLGRSAKAQRDVKNELETVRKAYEAALSNCSQLEKRLEVLANRPTHMDLLADFETNFDRALLSASSMGIGGGGLSRNNNQQSGGEDAAETTTSMTSMYDNMVSSSSSSSSSGKQSSSRAVSSDQLLTIELAESQDCITHLTLSNTTLQERVTALEHENQTLLLDNTTARNTLTNLQLELRMSKMEAEHHVRTIKDKDANITEMQLEIDLVTQSAVDANRRAAEGYVVAQTARSDKEYVEGLEMKVAALQEWALASTESKQLTLDRCRILEGRVKELEGMIYQLISGGGGDGTSSEEDNLSPQTLLVDYTPHRPTLHHPSSSSSSVGGNSSMGGNDNEERSLWTKSSSLVIGAGMFGHVILELGQVHIESYETVVLRWKFDITPNDLDIYFSILKGSVNCVEDKKLMRGADACFRHRHVTSGGGGGDVSGAFAKQNSCTLLWSNEMSWVRPRTIKWTVEAVAIEWND
jgi:regulator of replication initiation timing